MKIEELASGIAFPEGPVAMDDGSVLFVEVAGDRLRRWTPDGRVSTVAVLGDGPNGAAMGPDGACYVANNGGFGWKEEPGGHRRPHGVAAGYDGGRIQRVSLETGRVEVLYDRCDGHKLLGPNDLVFDRHGGFYFTDLGKTVESDRRRDLGSVYYAKADGSMIREVVFPIFTPNGIGLSPDGSTLYVADTESARLWGFQIESPGVVRKEPFPSSTGGRLLAACGDHRLQRFDSLAVDAEGNVNVGTLVHGGVTVVPPEGGRATHLPVDDLYVTNLCFGGPQLRTAFLTLSWAGKLVSAPWPTAGLRLNYAC
ncbi:MAG: SMP-30/gluconolactonase/LRE family protein [Comamonadaceae bacterium]|nr:MAG: SMP-30/gluconolactonase/LRE family protein [Comamonadaceae bacterium]